MSKWINDRAWTVSMYICYALCFIILSVAGYNYTMSIIGETSSIMKVVLFICIILFVGFGVSMVFSIFITPLSELLSRLLWYLFRLKTKKAISPDIDAMAEDIETDNAANDTNIGVVSEPDECKDTIVTSIDDSVRESLKAEFMSEYVRVEYRNLPIYDVFESLFDQEKSGAFAARAFKCAMSDPIKWLKSFPGYEDAKRLFPKRDSIKGGKTNYSNANNTVYSEKTMNETVEVIRDRLKELTPPPKEDQE